MHQHVEYMHKMTMFYLIYLPSSTILVFIWFQELRYQMGAFHWITKWSWTNVKMSTTTGVYLTHGPSGQNPRPSGPRSRPARDWDGSAWDLVDMSLHWFTRKDPRLEGGGGREEWPVGHVDGRPSICSKPTFPCWWRLPSAPLRLKTHYLQFSTCKGFGLVVVAQVKPYWELRVNSSICSSIRSSLRDRWALYRLWVLFLICFVLVFILSFNACIVSITWSRLFLVIALRVICLTR
jgi:hypothetical protein